MRHKEPYAIRKQIDAISLKIIDERRKGKVTKQLVKLEKDRSKLRADLEKMTKGITMSDHALIRYIERAMNIDMEKVRGGIVDNVSKLILTDGRYPIGEGIFAIVRDKTIVTVIDNSMKV